MKSFYLKTNEKKKQMFRDKQMKRILNSFNYFHVSVKWTGKKREENTENILNLFTGVFLYKKMKSRNQGND